MVPLKRKSQKKLEILDDKFPYEDIAKLWIKEDYNEALEWIEKYKGK
jgi:hypothetical protein